MNRQQRRNTEQEVSPDWQGNLRLIDCENKQIQELNAGADTLKRYQQAYSRHFETWTEESRRLSVRLARISAETEFKQALLDEALPSGAVELWI